MSSHNVYTSKRKTFISTNSQIILGIKDLIYMYIDRCSFRRNNILKKNKCYIPLVK